MALGDQTVRTSSGKYTIILLTKNRDKFDFEQVAIQKENGPIMQVNGIIDLRTSFLSTDNKKLKDLKLYQINVGQDYVGEFVIEDKELWDILVKVYNLASNNNAFEYRKAQYNYVVMPSGFVKKLKDRSNKQLLLILNIKKY